MRWSGPLVNPVPAGRNPIACCARLYIKRPSCRAFAQWKSCVRRWTPSFLPAQKSYSTPASEVSSVAPIILITVLQLAFAGVTHLKAATAINVLCLGAENSTCLPCRPGPTAIAGALRKLYHAREVLRQKCAELNQKLVSAELGQGCQWLGFGYSALWHAHSHLESRGLKTSSPLLPAWVTACPQECAKQQVEVEQAQRFAAAALTPGWLEQGTPGPFDTPNPPLDLNLPDVGMDIDLKL